MARDALADVKTVLFWAMAATAVFAFLKVPILSGSWDPTYWHTTNVTYYWSVIGGAVGVAFIAIWVVAHRDGSVASVPLIVAGFSLAPLVLTVVDKMLRNATLSVAALTVPGVLAAVGILVGVFMLKAAGKGNRGMPTMQVQ